MKPVVSFEIPGDVLNLKYTVKIPRKNHCVSYDRQQSSFSKFIHNAQFEKSSVGRSRTSRMNHATDTTDESVRSSEVADNVKDIYFGEIPAGKPSYYREPHRSLTDELIMPHLSKIVPRQFQDCIVPKCEYTTRYQCIKYSKGGHFARHRDSIRNSRHFASILLLIPSGFSPETAHIGGALTIYGPDGESYVFESDTILHPTFVIFNPTLEHSVSEIVDGTRFIFKTDWSYDEDLYELISAQPVDLSTLTVLHNSHKVDLQRTFQYIVNEVGCLSDNIAEPVDFSSTTTQLVAALGRKREILIDFKDKLEYMLTELENNGYDLKRLQKTYLTNELIRKIRDSEKNIIIFRLINYYPSANAAALYDCDIQLYKDLIREFGEASVRIRNMTHGENSEDEGELNKFIPRHKHSYIDYPTEKDHDSTVEVIGIHDYISGQPNEDEENEEDEELSDNLGTYKPFPDKIMNTSIGRRLRTSEYNDSTYDTIYNDMFTCFIILKNM